MAEKLVIFPASTHQQMADAIAAASVGGKRLAGLNVIKGAFGSAGYRIKGTRDGVLVLNVLMSGEMPIVGNEIVLPTSYSELTALSDAQISTGAWLITIERVDGTVRLEGKLAKDGGPFQFSKDLASGNNFFVQTLKIILDPALDQAQGPNRPTLTITDNISAATANGPVTFTFTWSVPVLGFTIDDITVTGGTAGTLQGSGAVYTLTVTPPAESSGTITVSVAANTVVDQQGVANNTGGSASQDFNTISGSYTPGTPPSPIIDWVVQSTDSPIIVPNDYIMLESDWWSGTTQYRNGTVVTEPTYSFGSLRMAHNEASSPGITWAEMEWNGPGQIDWTWFDRFWDAYPANKPRVFGLVYTPPWCVKYQSPRTAVFGNPELQGGASPPTDPQYIADFAKRVLDHLVATGRPLPDWLELWNEQNFGNDGPWEATTYDTRITGPDGDVHFFTGTARDFVGMARAVKLMLLQYYPQVKLMPGGFTHEDELLDYWGPMVNSIYRLGTCPDGFGGYGRDWFDGLAYHTYIYGAGADAITTIDVIRRYYKRFFNAPDHPTTTEKGAGFSPNLPLFNTEMGHEYSSGAIPPVATIANNIKRALLINASFKAKRMSMFKHSIDLMGYPHQNAIVGQKIDEVAALPGGTIREAGKTQNGTFWVRLQSGVEFEA